MSEDTHALTFMHKYTHINTHALHIQMQTYKHAHTYISKLIQQHTYTRVCTQIKIHIDTGKQTEVPKTVKKNMKKVF